MEQWISTSDNPFEVFKAWFEQGCDNTSFEPTKMTLATVDSNGMPAARVVLLKKHDDLGFCFYTNYESAKSDELESAGKAALVFHWEKPFHRQIRVRGLIEKMSYEESNEYFQTRARGSQIGAWASPQSQVIKDRAELEKKVSEIEAKFPEGSEIPCPENWGGFRLKPLSIEFWQAGEHRLHDRMKFQRSDLSQDWVAQRLAP